MNTELLEEIGLIKSEIAVYLALLELGSSSTGKIVEKSKASSSKIYEILDKLIDKGLASYIIRSGIKHFEAAPPERLLNYMEEKQEKLSTQKNELQKILPELEIKREFSKHKSEAKIFKGIKGAETAFKYLIDNMKKDDEWVGFVVTFTNQNYYNLLTKLHKYRGSKKLKSRIIMNNRHANDGKNRKNIPRTLVKYVPDENQTPFVINVAGNTVLLNIMSEEITIFMIENAYVALSFKKQFEELWNRETFMIKGVKALENIFYDMLEEKHADLIGARGYLADNNPEFIKEWLKKAIEKGFTMRNIVDKDVKDHKITKFPFAKTKYSLDKTFVDLSVFWIYGNKVVISNWAGKEPIAMIIETKEIVDMYKKQFELLWNKK